MTVVNGPCEELALLQAARTKLLSGAHAESVEYVSPGGVSRRLTFARVDMASLEAQIARLQTACDALSTVAKPSRRHAISTGGSSTSGFFR
jgi:hypothetical protein